MRELSGELTARGSGLGPGGQGAFERLFEGATPLVERLRAAGPFASDRAMLVRAREILAELSEAQQVAVINAHPRIGERPELVWARSARAFREQGYDRDDTPPQVFVDLARLNEQYESKFGFRFVVFVNRRPKAALVPVLEARLRRSPDEERATALEEILAIAEDRLKQEAS